MNVRHDKIQSRIKELAGLFIAREADVKSLITVTNAHLSDDGKNITILITVLPDSREEMALGFLNRRRQDFRNYVQSNARLFPIPRVTFAIDAGEKNRQRIDELGRSL